MATLLLAVLIPAFFVTTLHHHHEPSHKHDCTQCATLHHDIHKHHLVTAEPDSWGNCFICHFVFSPVNEAHSFEMTFRSSFATLRFVDVINTIRQNTLRYYSLRAPPTASLFA